MIWVVPVTAHSCITLKHLECQWRLLFPFHSDTCGAFCKVRKPCEERGRTPFKQLQPRTCAHRWRQSRCRPALVLGGTLADVSGREETVGTRSGWAWTCEPTKSAQIQQKPKVCLRQGRVDALRDLTQVNKRRLQAFFKFFFLSPR